MVTLYIKTHNKTGLKYFGKTTKDVETYSGSGLYWKRHIKQHGDDVTTEIYGTYNENDPKLVEDALEFSYNNNIVESNEWANMKPENGLDGAVKGAKHTEETLQKMSEALQGRKITQDHRNKISKTLQGREFTTEHKEKISKARSGPKSGKDLEATLANQKKMVEANTGRKQSKETQIKKSKSLKEYYKNLQDKSKPHLYKSVRCNGIVYESVLAVMEKFEVSRPTVINRIRSDKWDWEYCSE